MSLRKGITTMEEAMMKKAIRDGKTWKEIAPELEDCDLDYVKENLYDPMAGAQEAADMQDAASKPKPPPAKA